MTGAALRRQILRGRLALARPGWQDYAALALFLAGLAACAALPWLDARLAVRRAALDAFTAQTRTIAHAAPPAPVLTPAQTNLAAFRAVLGDAHQAEQTLKTLFAAAEGQLIPLDQADYKLSYDKAGRFYVYSARLPVAGSYLAIRYFTERFLLDVPFASLDDIGFKRRAVGDTTIEAKLHLTLYLDGPPDYAAGIAGRSGDSR